MIVSDIVTLDERYFLYFEDVQYSKTLEKKGFQLDFCKESIVYHKISASTSKLSHTKTHKLRSMVTFYRHNYPYLIPIVIGMRILFYLLSGKLGNAKEIFQSLLGIPMKTHETSLRKLPT
jgi:GT2 family glycosyltransferase